LVPEARSAEGQTLRAQRSLPFPRRARAPRERPASPAARPNMPRQRRRASCRLVNALVRHFFAV